jgi:hydroxypyruvate isomerase
VFRFAAHLSILYGDLSLLQAAERAKAAGFDLVEMWWPTERALAGLTPLELADRIRGLGLTGGLINFYAGDLAAGDRGLVADPDQREAFRAHVPEALEVARRLGARKINASAGNLAPGQTRAAAIDSMVDNLRFAADRAREFGITLQLEALNHRETPRYLLPDVAAALDALILIDRPNVMLLVDVYHVAMAGQEPVAVIERAGRRIGHVQIADCPGRHEPGTGTLRWPEILAALARAGYRGSIGLEFAPTVPNEPDFAFLREFLEVSARLAK